MDTSYNFHNSDPYEEVKNSLIDRGKGEEKIGKKGFYFWAKEIITNPLFQLDAHPLDEIISQRGEHNLTLLHVAALSANSYALDILLNKGADPNIGDHRGWRAAHHLFAHNSSLRKKMMLQLKEKGADLSLKNDRYATADKLHTLTVTQVFTTPPCYWRESASSHRLVKMSDTDYFAKTKSTYLRENLVEPGFLIDDWHRSKEPLQDLYPFSAEIAKQYVDYRRNPTKHLLSPVLTDSSGNPIDPSPGLGLYSEGRFPTKQIVGEYIGKIYREQRVGDYTLTNHCDAARYSSPETRINCSFPNVVMMRLPAEEGIEGLPYRSVFVSMEEVAGQFCWNYGGHHSLKFGPYIEMRPKELRDFVRNANFDRLLPSLLLELSDRCPDWERLIKAEKLRYIMQTPSALFLLTLEGVLSDRDTTRLLEFAFKSELLAKREETKKCVSAAIELRAIILTLSIFQPNIAREVKEFFLEMPAYKQLSELVNAASDTSRKLGEANDIPATWNSIKKELQYKNKAADKLPRHPASHFSGSPFSEISIGSSSSTPLNYPPKVFKPTILGKDPDEKSRYAVCGIGRKLTEADVGKSFVRTLPIRCKSGVYDWSYVPYGVDAAKSAAKTIAKVEGNRIWIKFANKLHETNPLFHDKHWIEAERYEEAVKPLLESEVKWREKLKIDRKGKATYRDYSYIEPVAAKSSEKQREPNFHSEDPREVLGLNSSESSFATVHEKYIQLAQIYHPDKSKSNNHKIFQQINNADKKLEKELGVHPFVMERSLNVEENYGEASLYFAALLKRDIAVEKLVEEWDHFITEVERLQNHPEKEADSIFELLTSRLLTKAKNARSYYNIKIALSALKIPEASLSSSEKVAILKEEIVKCDRLIANYDLNNEDKGWLSTMRDKYKEANDLVVDKRIALCCTLAEVYFVNDKDEDLLELRNDVLYFHAGRELLQKLGSKIADEENVRFNLKLMVRLLKKMPCHRPEDPSKEKFAKEEELSSSSIAKEEELSSSSIAKEEELSSSSIAKVKTEEKREAEKKKNTLQSNIRANIAFFNYKKFSHPEEKGFIKV